MTLVPGCLDTFIEPGIKRKQLCSKHLHVYLFLLQDFNVKSCCQDENDNVYIFP